MSVGRVDGDRPGPADDGTLRVFAAIRPSEAVLAPLRAWWASASLRLPDDAWRPLPSENWHVTLAFYGDLPVHALPRLRTRLNAIAADTTPFGIVIRGCGVFPDPERARVFWAGIAGEPPATLARLAQRCLCAVDGTNRDDPRKGPQTYRGHLSLARARGRRSTDLSWFIRNPPPPLTEQVSLITLYRSDLSPEGSRYTAIDRFALKD